ATHSVGGSALRRLSRLSVARRPVFTRFTRLHAGHKSKRRTIVMCAWNNENCDPHHQGASPSTAGPFAALFGMPLRTSRLTENLRASAILRVAGEVRALVKEGKQITDLTVGDFSSKEFRIPRELEDGIVD